MNRRYVLKNHRRFYIFIMLLTVLTTIILLSTVVNGSDSYNEYETITVKRGDTLWDLAEEYSDSTDIRAYIRKIKKINDMSDSSIYEGDLLKLPL
ncbi:MAG: LysM peptidoglycan-binding domain-containing protein [Clostridiaceae bacterium]|nr:LysM peptidoglycan-binding domain-containing protein [Clostridiaceae bacterium]